MTTEEAGPARPAVGAEPTLRVLVMVGTDFHRFDRVVTWVDEWAARHRDAVHAVVQHGTSAAPRHAEGHAMLEHAELQRLVREADVIVTHGGPATITEVRQRGLRPVVVPRDPARDEHVDGHQQRFARRMGASGLVELCEDRPALEAALDAALADPASLRLPTAAAGGPLVADPAVAAAVERVGAIVDELAAARRSRRR